MGKKAIKELVKAYNKACKDYKKTVNESFDTMETVFAEEEEKTKKK